MINPNANLPNRNNLYLGRSGTGKSQALKQNKEIPTRGARVLLYDPNLDHKAHRYESKAAFAKAVRAAVKRGGGFRIAYTGGCGEADHEFYCRVALSILDGNKITYVIDEELGASGSRTGSAAKWHAILMNQGRKYGLRYHGVVQFATEVPKTVYRNCEVKWVGALETEAAKKLSKEIDVPTQEIIRQKPLQFYVKDPDKGFEAEQIQLTYQQAA